MTNIKRWLLSVWLLFLLVLLCACRQNPSQEQLYGKLFAHFESFGFACQLQPLEPERAAPIYKPSAWQKLMLDGEEALVYFDDSNRADYLSASVDEETFGYVTRFGLRFVITYDGDDAKVLEALQAIEND